jgi:hypothetical protein
MIQLPLTDIRAAINNVVETFATTPVVYHWAKAASLDRYGEGQSKAPSNINLLGFVEHGADQIEQNMIGSLDFQGVKIMFKGTDWETAGLYVNGEVKADPARDFLTVNGKKYKVTNVMPDGAFETRNFIIIVLATLQPQAS